MKELQASSRLISSSLEVSSVLPFGSHLLRISKLEQVERQEMQLQVV